jgi:hypothetical protein
MELPLIRSGFVFDSLVLVFQLAGLAGLVASRFMPATRWAGRGRLLVLLALLGLGVAGAICHHHRSGMGLSAGGTMTILLVGMISGSQTSGATPATAPTDPLARPLTVG